jgi:hypothetical protein
MLALKLGKSLPSSNSILGFNPFGESSLLAWYKNKNKVVLSLSGTDVVSWGDSSKNQYNLVQLGAATEQPSYDAPTGGVKFDETKNSNLNLSSGGAYSQISITGEFSIGVKINPTDFGGTILGDNNTSSEFIKYFSNSIIRLKIDGVAVNLSLDSDTFGDGYILLTRDSSDLVKFYYNGVLQVDTETLAGTFDIDSMGVRAVDLSPLGATIFDAQIYTSESADLSSNINEYLANI